MSLIDKLSELTQEQIKDFLTNLPPEQKQTLEQIIYQAKYNKLSIFKPYPWQVEFFNASKDYKQRYLRAGNRCGKSYSEAHEFAMHITGRYPEWYEGERISNSGHYYWCMGISLDTTADVMQAELFGTKDIRIIDEVGTGSIPKSCIDFEFMVKDGRKLKSCRIKHSDGGYNTVQFFASEQGHMKVAGQKAIYCWLDEEPENRSDEIYSQLVTRVTEAEGWLTFTSTPEQGLTELNRRYEENKLGNLYMQQATWDDVPHLTEDMKQQLLAGVAEWQHDMRIRGLPVIGSGAVFPFDDSDLIVDEFPIPDHYLIDAGIDIGHTSDSSTVMYAAMDNPDPSIATFYLFNEWEGDNKKDPSLGNPDAMSYFIKNSAYSSIPVIAPHDAGAVSGAPEAYASKLRAQNINVSWDTFHNPYDSKVGISSLQKAPSNNNPETGLVLMRQLMAEGRLKIFRNCTTWLNEKRSYYYKENGKRSKPDHMQDAGRLAVVSLMAGRGVRADECMGFIAPIESQSLGMFG